MANDNAPDRFDDTKVVCIWYSALREAWLLEIVEPGNRRFDREELAVEVAKRLGFTHRMDPDDDTKIIPL